MALTQLHKCKHKNKDQNFSFFCGMHLHLCLQFTSENQALITMTLKPTENIYRGFTKLETVHDGNAFMMKNVYQNHEQFWAVHWMNIPNIPVLIRYPK